MDLIVEKLSNLESIWRLTNTENVSSPDDFDIFEHKISETKRLTGVIDELISEAFERKKKLLEDFKELFIKIEEEIKEIGVPFVLQPLQSNLNLPKQVLNAENIWKDLLVMKDFMTETKKKLLAESFEMYKEEIESNFEGLPHWIHSLFEDVKDASYSEDSSFTTAAISHLDAAIVQLDPFYPTLSSSLAKVEAAHEILQSRLELFKVEIEALWREIEGLSSKLRPFNCEETKIIEAESKLVEFKLDNRDNLTTTCSSRSCLRKVLFEWKRIEKERGESISGSILLIGRLWNLLETPPQDRFPLSNTDLSIENMTRLSSERNRLINFQQQKFKELYDSQVLELKKLMEALKWGQQKQDLILLNCQSYTADGLQYLACQLAILQPKLELSLAIISSISTRSALITKMREFEKSASDPARLFRSSFQLLQEEKFRKTALPSLLSLELQIKTQLNEFKLKFDEDFVYEDSDFAFIQILEEEIASRFMSSGIFGFDQGKQRKERVNSERINIERVGSDKPPRYTTNTLNTNTTNNAGECNNRKIPTNVIPQRRKFDK